MGSPPNKIVRTSQIADQALSSMPTSQSSRQSAMGGTQRLRSHRNGRSRSMATTLTSEQMKQFVKDHFEDFVNKRNAAVIHKNMTPDFYDHDGPGGRPTDLAGDEQMMVGMYNGMPDLHLTIEEMIAEDDKVVCRNTWSWTDQSGKKMQFHGFVLWRFEGDKIAERWATVTPPAESNAWTEAGAEKAGEKRAR